MFSHTTPDFISEGLLLCRSFTVLVLILGHRKEEPFIGRRDPYKGDEVPLDGYRKGKTGQERTEK